MPPWGCALSTAHPTPPLPPCTVGSGSEGEVTPSGHRRVQLAWVAGSRAREAPGQALGEPQDPGAGLGVGARGAEPGAPGPLTSGLPAVAPRRTPPPAPPAPREARTPAFPAPAPHPDPSPNCEQTPSPRRSPRPQPGTPLPPHSPPNPGRARAAAATAPRGPGPARPPAPAPPRPARPRPAPSPGWARNSPPAPIAQVGKLRLRGKRRPRGRAVSQLEPGLLTHSPPPIAAAPPSPLPGMPG
ncbi:uncharacterized protein [Muntiacus reevesi]|uniref:uncharacterized protein n=1 Tax=Muntiacus reevesi TaxID=9886 RepID=UPI0033077154